MGKKFRNRQISPANENGDAQYIREEYEEADVSPVAEQISFEDWYALRKSAIPTHHHQEILVADFKGRKVPMTATMAEFDEALKKYGVELV